MTVTNNYSLNGGKPTEWKNYVKKKLKGEENVVFVCLQKIYKEKKNRRKTTSVNTVYFLFWFHSKFNINTNTFYFFKIIQSY